MIISSVATGNGAYVLHKELEKSITDYKVISYSPYLTYFPLSLLLLRNRNADLLHMQPDYAPFFHVKGIPMIVTFHSFNLDKELDPYNTWMQKIHYRTDLRWLTLRALALADQVTCVSRFLERTVKDTTGYQGEIRVICNGVDEQLFLPKKKQEKKNIEVLFCGNVTRKKGGHLLPEIARRLDENITIYYTSGLRSGERNFNDPRLISLGKIPYDQMPSLYPRYDILLFPTVREGMSLALLEAMSCGLPAVASDCSSMPEVIDNGLGGFLCPVGDVEAFADRLNHLADDRRLRQQMGEYNRIRVEQQFTLDRMVNEYRDLFRERLERRYKKVF